MGFDKGASAVYVTAGGSLQYYRNYTTTNLYVELTFGGNVNTITLMNDSTTDIIYISFDGVTVHCSLSPLESITLTVSKKSGVYIRGTAGGDTIRVWGW